MTSHVFTRLFFWLTLSLFFNGGKGIKSCNTSMWRIVNEDSHSPGHSKLKLTVDKEFPSGSYEVVLACHGVIVKGPGLKTIELSRTKTRHVFYDLHLKTSDAEFSDTPIEYHTCMVELKQKMVRDVNYRHSNTSHFKTVAECQIKLKAVLWRFVPHCSDIDKSIMTSVDKQTPGTIAVHFRHNNQNVAKISRDCSSIEVFQDLKEEDLSDMFSLTSPLRTEKIYNTNFYPDCENLDESYHKQLMAHKDQHKQCFLIVDAACQEGHVHLGTFSVELTPDAFDCPEEESAFILFVQRVKLTIRVESDPIAILAVILAGVLASYLLLVPCMIIACLLNLEKCSNTVRRRWRIIQRKRRRTNDDDKFTKIHKIKDEKLTKYRDGDVMLVYESTTDVKKKAHKAKPDKSDKTKSEKEVHHTGNFKQKHSTRKEKPKPKIKALAEIYSDNKKTKHVGTGETKESKLGPVPQDLIVVRTLKTSPPVKLAKTQKTKVDVENHKQPQNTSRSGVGKVTAKVGRTTLVVGAAPTKEVRSPPKKHASKTVSAGSTVHQKLVRSQQQKGRKGVNSQQKGGRSHLVINDGLSNTTGLKEPSSKISKQKTKSSGGDSINPSSPSLGHHQNEGGHNVVVSSLKAQVPNVKVTEAPILADADTRSPITKDTLRKDKSWADNFSEWQLISAMLLFFKKLEPSISDQVVASFTAHLNKDESAHAIDVLLTELDQALTEGDTAKSMDQVKVSQAISLFLQEIDNSLSAKDTGDSYFSDRKNRATLLTKKLWDTKQSLQAFHSLLDEIRSSVNHLPRIISSAEGIEGTHSIKSSRLSLQAIDPLFLKDAVKSFLKSLDPSLPVESIINFLKNLEDSQLEEAIEAFLDGLGLPLGPITSDQLDPSLSDKAVGALLEKLDSQEDTAQNQNPPDDMCSTANDNKTHSSSIYLYEKRIFQLKPLDPQLSAKAVEAFMNEISFFDSNHGQVGGRRLKRQGNLGKERTRYVSGATVHSTSFSGQSSPQYQHPPHNSAGVSGQQVFRHSVSCQGMSNEKNGTQNESVPNQQHLLSTIDASLLSPPHFRHSISCQGMADEKTNEEPARTTKSNSFSYHQMLPTGARQVIDTVPGGQQKSRKIFKKSSITSAEKSKNGTDIPFLDAFTAKQIKSFAESTQPHASNHSDEYASAVSKHPSSTLTKPAMSKSSRSHSAQMGQVKEDNLHLTTLPYQPDSSVKYTLVRRHTGVESQLQYESKHVDNSENSPRRHLTEIPVSPRFGMHNRSTQYPRQELINKTTQSPPYYELLSGVVPSQDDHCAQEYSQTGFVVGEFERTRSSPGNAKYVRKVAAPRSRFEPDVSLSVRTMEEGQALRRFFKRHRNMQDFGLSFASASNGQGIMLSESGTGSEGQPSSEAIPVLGDLYRTSYSKIPFINDQEVAKSQFHKASLDSSQMKQQDTEKSKQDATQESGEQKPSTVRKISKQMKDQSEPENAQFKPTLDGRSELSTAGKFTPGTAHIEHKTSQSVKPANTPDKDKQQNLSSQDSDQSYKSLEEHFHPEPSSSDQDKSRKIPSSSIDHHQTQSRKDKNIIQHSSFIAENSSNIGDSLDSGRPVPSLPSSMEGQLLESLAFLQEKSPSFSSSPSTDDELTSEQNVPLIQERVIRLKESVMAADHSHPSNISSSLVRMSSMAVNKSSSYTLDHSSPFGSSPFISSPFAAEPSTTLQSSSTVDQPSDNLELMGSYLQAPQTSSSVVVIGESPEAENGEKSDFFLSLSPDGKTETFTQHLKQMRMNRDSDDVLSSTDDAR